MSRLVAVVITAAVCLPLGALLRRDATADPRGMNGLVAAPIPEHPHLARALAELHRALDEIDASRHDGEPFWSDGTGRAAALLTSVADATHGFDQTAQWLRDGMQRNGPRFTAFRAAMPGPMATTQGVLFVPWMHP